MKMNKVALVIVAVLLVLLLSGGCLLVVYEINQKQLAAAQEEAEKDVVTYDYKTFADYTKVDVYASIPVLEVEGGNIENATEVGTGVYSLTVSGTTLDDYKNYLTTMQEKGFKKHSDNGEEGIEGYVYSALISQII